MIIQNKILNLLLFVTLLFGATPTEYVLSISTGYDNNVMRFSEKDFTEALVNPKILGNATTYDSYILKVSLRGKKTIYKNKNNEIIFKGNFSTSDYRNNKNKKYWNGGGDIEYKWGSYKNIRYSIRHLNSYYLRHYINRDIGNSSYEPCLFTDRNQSFSISQKFSKQTWSNVSLGYIQRYYDKPFTEFDLDIFYLRGKQNFRLKKFGIIAIQYESGRASSNSNESPLRPSSFDRSYNYSELYIPMVKNKNLILVDELGMSYRLENRKYDAEDFNDPLHSGRSHQDSKYDAWMKKQIFEDMKVKLAFRIRDRSTVSSYNWVSDLKSFNQLQTWISIEWKIDYDKY